METENAFNMSNLNFGFSTNKKSNQGDKKKGSDGTKKKYEKNKRKQVFCSKWMDEFHRLEYDEARETMFCKACHEGGEARRFSEGTYNFRIDTVKSHNESSSHIRIYRHYQ